MADRNNFRRATGGLLSFIVLASIVALFFAFHRRELVLPLHRPRLPVNARQLPYYAFCSLARMTVAYVIAMIFSIIYGLLAGRSRAWERILIPVIDVAQSVPVVGFFPAAIYFFVALAHGHRIGVEM